VTAVRLGGEPDGWPTDDRDVWAAALAGAAAMFLVQPPADLWWLAWIAPLPWLVLVRATRLPGRHPGFALWTAGFVHWLLAIHWLRLPHPATSLGWLALSAYLALYVPLFVWAARRLVHRWRWPLVPAAVIAWMGCEQLRGTLLGGFTFGMLGHTQWRWTTLIQLADAFGAVGVGGVVMAVAAAATTLLATRCRRAAAIDSAVAAVAVLVAVGYGAWRLAGEPVATDRPLDVLLVQGSVDTELKHDPDAAIDVAQHYDALTLEGLAASGTSARPDLIVWPETMWRWGLLEIDPAERLPEPVVEEMLGPPADEPTATDDAERQALCRTALERQRIDALSAYAMRYGTTWLVGVDKQRVTPEAVTGAEHFNCGLFLDAEGRVLACYDKMHPVMFGEYVPFAETFPILYRLTPLPAGLSAGLAPVGIRIAGYEVAPTICYETALPEAIRGLVRQLAAGGRRPDVIVNLTNDGWFWGSSELDMHLTAAVFRAIEVRTPIVVAANTGFSAWIDGSGRLLARGPRRAVATLRAAVRRDGRASPWLTWGSLPAGGCMAVVVAVTLESLRRGPAGRAGGSTKRARPGLLEPA
jgi:apolipoprotein N-acyltransferase